MGRREVKVAIPHLATQPWLTWVNQLPRNWSD